MLWLEDQEDFEEAEELPFCALSKVQVPKILSVSNVERITKFHRHKSLFQKTSICVPA